MVRQNEKQLSEISPGREEMRSGVHLLEQDASELTQCVASWIADACRDASIDCDFYRSWLDDPSLTAQNQPLAFRVQQALRDRTDHVRLLGILSEQWGGEPLPEVTSAPPASDFASFAKSNVERGCVRALVFAELAHIQAGRALEPGIVRVMRRLAHDGLRLAQLSWDLHQDLSKFLDQAERVEISIMLQESMKRLKSGKMGIDVSESARKILGLPEELEMLRLSELTAEILERSGRIG